MRLFPRFRLPRFRSFSRAWRQLKRRLTVARVVIIIELLVFGSVLWFVTTGSRIARIDQFGQRGDAIAISTILGLCYLLHWFVKRRVVTALERHFSPAPYDESRILFDLGQEAREAESIDQLYESIVGKIGEALEAGKVTIFVRDETSGDYICRHSTSQPATTDKDDSSTTTAPLELAGNAFIVTRLRHLSEPLVVEPAEFEVWTRALAAAPQALREARQREREVLEAIEARLLLQIRTKDQLAGILCLGPRRGLHLYSPADKEMLMTLATQVAFVIENSKLLERIVAEEKLRRDLALAALVQQRLLPTGAPVSNLIELSGICHPARGVGGDYYDFLALENQQIGIAIADVAGKGIAAALLMSTVQASLRSQAMSYNATSHSESSLAGLVTSLNLLLCRSTQGANYVTFFYAQFDERTRKLTYVNAGHNPPFLLRRESATNGTADNWLKLSTGGLFIGAFDHMQYEQETLDLLSGDVIVAYTDGVTEALNRAGEEFGEEQLQEILSTSAYLPAEEIREQVLERVREWCIGAPQYDDLTFIVLKVK